MVRLTFRGRSCWEIRGGEHRVLVDPFLSGNDLADVGPEAFEKLDALIVTHGHSDHLGDGVAVKATEFIDARVTIPMHYGTFASIESDPLAFVERVKARGRRAVVVEPGESYDVE